MLAAMTEEDWTIVLKVFEASRSRRGDKGRNDRKFLEALQYFVVSQHHLAAGGGGRLGVGPARGLTLLSSLPRIATNSASSSMALHPRPSRRDQGTIEETSRFATGCSNLSRTSVSASTTGRRRSLQKWYEVLK
jgi:hypothetical protein